MPEPRMVYIVCVVQRRRICSTARIARANGGRSAAFMSDMKLSLACSPCPNDTFMFHGLASGKMPVEGCELEVHLHDIETLNRLALRGTYAVTKLSFGAWMLARRHYRLLNAGAAMGFGCGPLIVSGGGRELSRDDLRNCRIAVPGELTTAHLLLRLWAPHAGNKVFLRYDKIIPAVLAGEADCGVIIHESRFTYERDGLRKIVDLGEWWEQTTRLPVPLAAIGVRQDVPAQVASSLEDALRRSIADARANPAAPMEFARRHAREMDDDVLREHIRTFVNDYSLAPGPDARAATETLIRMATQTEADK